MYVLTGEQQLVLEVVGHPPELTVDEIPCPDEIRCGHAHESEYHLFLRLSAALRLDVRVQALYQFAVRFVRQIKIRGYILC